MTRTPFRIFILFTGLSLFLLCCKQAKRESSDVSVGVIPVNIDVTNWVVPPDSLPVFTTYPVLKPEIIKAGNPKISIANNNIHVAGEPVILKEEIPQTIIPGKDGFDLPDTIAFEFRKVPCVNKPARKALKPAFAEGSDFNLQHLDVEHGLATGELFSLFMDSRENVWMGTNGEGVIKYDGNYFTQYTSNEGLSANHVKCILEDEKGNIWFGTAGGLLMYDGNEFAWIVGKGDEAGRMAIHSMVADKKGNIWFGTFDNGLYKFEDSLLTRYNTKQGLDKAVYSLKEDSKGNLWIGVNYKGVYRYDGKIFALYNDNGMLSGNRINCIEEDAAGNIWIGTTAGLTKFNHHFFINYSKEQGLPFNYINCLRQDNSGNIWIGTEGGGACKFDGKNFYYYSKNEGFRSNQILNIMQDKSGILWFASYGGGVMKLNEKSFTNFNSIPALNQSIIYSVTEDKKENIWFGTQSGELIKYNKDTFYTYTQKEGFEGEKVRDILEDRNGNIWIAIQNGGICKFDGQSFFYYRIPDNNLLRGAFSLYEDSKGNMWFGLLHKGVVKFDGNSFTHFKLRKENVYEDIRSIMEDSKGNMWFRSSLDGTVAKFDGSHFTYYSHPGSDETDTFLEDSLGNIWMTGSGGSGITKYTGKEFYQFTQQNGLTDNSTKSLVQDKAGNLWIGTRSGLNYFENPAEKNGSPSRITQYSSADGLIGEDFQSNAALIDSKGFAWWGTNKAVNKLNLKYINRDTATPVIQLNTIAVKGLNADFHHLNEPDKDSPLPSAFKKIKYSGYEKFFNYPINPEIPFELNHLTFYFTAFDWAATGKLKYSYKIETLDDNWSELSDETFADYRSIPYGKYTFKVKAIGAANKWSTVFEYPFTINPPWWHTWWFRSLIVLLLIFSISTYLRYRTRSLLERQKYLQLTVDKRTEQLRVSLNEKEALLKEIHHRVKNNLEVISSLLKLQTKNVADESAKSALIEGQSRVQSIALIHHKLYSSDDMANIEVIDFANGLFKHISNVFKKPGEIINFIASGNETTVNTDTAVPVGLILNELFTNAFKYAIQPDRENVISLQVKETIMDGKTVYQMIFSDNGPGMPESFILEKSKSLGMKVIQLLTKQLGGKLSYYNKDGAVFEISFPKPAHSPLQKI
jgi:ligand-binding sensor domain-containing protein/two-component sensor histidine kinase